MLQTPADILSRRSLLVPYSPSARGNQCTGEESQHLVCCSSVLGTDSGPFLTLKVAAGWPRTQNGWCLSRPERPLTPEPHEIIPMEETTTEFKKTEPRKGWQPSGPGESSGTPPCTTPTIAISRSNSRSLSRGGSFGEKLPPLKSEGSFNISRTSSAGGTPGHRKEPKTPRTSK